MTKIDWKYYSKLKKEFMNDKQTEVEAVGYSMSCGLGFSKEEDLEQKVCFEIRLSPLPNSPNPIEKNLLARIKNDILTDNYKGVSLNIIYVRNILK